MARLFSERAKDSAAETCPRRIMKRLRLFAFWMALCLPAAAAAQDIAKKPEQTAGADKQAPVTQSDPALIKVDEFKIVLGDEAGFRRVQTGAIAEIVNPFSVRKRGRIYGSLYEFHRNDNFDARNYFDPVGEKRPEYKRNQFGGSLGFLASDRLTLFGTYDGLRINRGSTILSHVPTPEMKKGNFAALGDGLINPFTGKEFSNNQIPAGMIHPVSARLLSVIPNPNSADPSRNFVNGLPQIQNTNSFTGRVDFEFSENSKLFASYNLENSHEVETNSLPLFGATTKARNQSLSIEYNHDFSENMVASLGLQFSRERERQLSEQSGQHGLLASLGIAGLTILDDLDEGYPNFEISGYAGLGGDTDWPTTYALESLEISPSFTYVRGRHNFEFGGLLGSVRANNARTGGTRRGSFEFTGDYTGDAFADFLLGIPSVAERGVGSDRADFRRKYWVMSARDDWKINRKFSLSLALSYNYFPLDLSQHNNVSLFMPLLFEPPRDGMMVVTGGPEAARFGLGGLAVGQAAYTDRNDWSPEIGFAFSPLGNNRLVVRSSYQIHYDHIEEETAFEYIGRNHPFFYTERAEASEDSPDLNLSNPFQTATATELNIRAIDPHLRSRYAQEWQLLVQYEFLRNWNAEVSYTGDRATHSVRNLIANVPLPGPGMLQDRRPNPAYGRFSILSGSGAAFTNSLELDLKKRVSQGFSLQSSYTWTKELNDDADDPANPRNLRAEWGPDGDGENHQFSLNYILDLPFGRGQAVSLEWMGKLGKLFEGWRLSGITTFSTGSRFSPRLSGDANNDGVRGDRPDRIGLGILDSSQRSIDHWFDTAAFVAPGQQYGFGNCGRNVLIAPGRRNWDVSFIKRTRLTDSGNALELRVQLFNAFNNTNFSRPNSTFGTSVFGQIFGAGRAREIEVALKYTF
jgi:hypothetical protein